MLRQFVHFGSVAGSGQISSYCAGIAGLFGKIATSPGNSCEVIEAALIVHRIMKHRKCCFQPT